MDDQLRVLFELSGKSATENNQMLEIIRSMEQRIGEGRSEEEELSEAEKRISEDHPESSLEQKERKLEELRRLLRISLGSRARFNKDQMTFPFVIPVQDSEAVVSQVKIDTGSRPNWISIFILEKAGVKLELAGDLGYFIGASKDPLPFEPVGRASVTWFSENQAKTSTTSFLVHDGSLPFDVVLGSKWVFGEMAQQHFSEASLPIMRHIISRGSSLSKCPHMLIARHC